MSEVLGTGLAFPIGVDERGCIALASGATDVEQAIRMVLETAPGERPMRPEFGCAVHDCVFDRVDAETTGRIDEAVRTALDRWEPRIVVEAVDFELSEPAVGVVLEIAIRYRIKATNDVRNLVHPFYVVPEEPE